MSEKTVTVQQGASPLFLLFLVFLTLKLTENIGWSWWWVCAPVWVWSSSMVRRDAAAEKVGA